MKLRLDKLLAEITEGSRSEVKQWIRRNRILVDGEIATRPEIKVDPENQEICLDGTPVRYQQYEYYMLNKPQGVVSATRDDKNDTVISLVTESKRRDLFPVGRLDIDTEGLLLLTNDGELAHRLLSPRHHVDKTYLVQIEGVLSESDIDTLEQGMDIGDEKRTLPAVVESCRILSSTESQTLSETISEVYFTIQEGRYHQVKRMFAGIGKPVLYLKRIRMGNLKLDPKLAPGEYRPLTETEIKEI
ncbi:MAG: rRNA pseudouridine synthase [Lachnospiraceae bacterium]|nr:rRNA pseudouridine synthase [Lachnospiraceae bacterium]